MICSRYITLSKGIRRHNAAYNIFGSAFLEFALVVPLFLIFILGLCDMARYFTMESVLSQSAQQALSLAKVIPSLEDDSESSGTPVNAAVIKTIEEKASAFAKIVYGENAVFQASLSLPEKTSTLREALNTNPMEISLSAQMNPILPLLPPIKITQKVSGYREPLFSSSMPVLLNCKGEQVTASDWVNPSDCPCKGDKYAYKQADGTCKCKEQASYWWTYYGKEGMAPLQQDSAGTCSCAHIEGSTLTYDKTIYGYFCKCNCPDGYGGKIINGKCNCDTKCTDENKISDGKSNCICDPNTNCGPTGEPDPSNNCQCKCKYWPTKEDHNLPGSLYEFIQFDPAIGACRCYATEWNCPANTFMFESRNYYGRGICDCRYCDSSSTTYNAETHKCTCSLTAEQCKARGPSYYLQDYTPSNPARGCSCMACSSGKVSNTAGTGCVCPTSAINSCVSQNRLISSDYCTCSTLCAFPKVVNSSASACVCPANAASQCTSPKNYFQSSDCSCRCPQEANTTPCPATNSYLDTTECRCKCYGGTHEYEVNGTTLCRPNACLGASHQCQWDATNSIWIIKE